MMQQPGGLTDAQFDENPRQSVRSRNWFTPWNVFSLNFDTKIILSSNTKLFFGWRRNVGFATPNIVDAVNPAKQLS
jgi:Fe(3+) dicitrate transport protein